MKGDIKMADMKEIYGRLNEVFQDVFDDDSIVVRPETTAKDIDDWDSLEHIRLIAAVEREFGMRFKMGEVSTMKNVGEMAGIVAARMTR
jgi:acyl carrier protein